MGTILRIGGTLVLALVAVQGVASTAVASESSATAARLSYLSGGGAGGYSATDLHGSTELSQYVPPDNGGPDRTQGTGTR